MIYLKLVPGLTVVYFQLHPQSCLDATDWKNVVFGPSPKRAGSKQKKVVVFVMHVQWWQKRRVVVLWYVGEMGQDNRLRQVTMDIPYEIAFFQKGTSNNGRL